MIQKKRYALVGTGGRAKMYIDAVVDTFKDHAELVGLCDTSRVRMNVYDQHITQELGHPSVPYYHAGDFDTMIAETRPDTVIVTSMDSTHHQYIVRAMELGCDVITEKPMTTDLDKTKAIFAALHQTEKKLRVTFNYRYSPQSTKIKELLMQGVVGKPLKVDFMWTLDVRHGADYFRRWHGEKDKSGGLLVHKSSHHFDLINWWLESRPAQVFALGDLSFYGRKNAAARGEHYSYKRYTGVQEAKHDPFALRLDEDAQLKALYLDAEAETGYLRDRNVFNAQITTEDNLSLIARYANGVQLTYSLVAFSPWEGFKVAITGTKGRLELDMIERSKPFVAGQEETLEQAQPEFTRSKQLRVYPMWDAPYEVEIIEGEGGHGGGDPLILQDLFLPDQPADPYKRAASHIDGAHAILVGIAGNIAIETGQPVDVDVLIAGWLDDES